MHGLTAEQLDGCMVRIISDSYPNYIGEARDSGEHGWIYVYLDAVDPEDERVFGPMGADDVELYQPGE